MESIIAMIPDTNVMARTMTAVSGNVFPRLRSRYVEAASGRRMRRWGRLLDVGGVGGVGVESFASISDKDFIANCVVFD